MIIWLASYPRSGNTFLRILLRSAFGLPSSSVYDEKVAPRIAELIGHENLPLNASIGDLVAMQKVFMLKTHDAPVDDARAIYLVRDARAALSSYYFFHQTVLKMQVPLRDLILGTQGVGSWSQHLAQWHPLDRPNTLLLKFEELTAEPHLFVQRISEFIRCEPISTNVPSFEELHTIAPRFFRSGRSESWREVFGAQDLELFWQLHGAAMSTFGYARA